MSLIQWNMQFGREWLNRMLYTMTFCVCEIQIKHGILHLLLSIEWLPFRLYVQRYTHCTCTLLVYLLNLFRIILLAYIYINSYGKLGLLITVLNNNLWEPLRAIFMFKQLEIRRYKWRERQAYPNYNRNKVTITHCNIFFPPTLFAICTIIIQ
jgi:hypothetical protein